MWKNNTLYFDTHNTAKSFDDLENQEKLRMYLKRVQETYIDIAKEIDDKNDARYGFASILLSCSAIEALGKVFYNRHDGATYRFNQFCLNNLQIRPTVFREIDLYSAFRCGLAHEGRIKKRFSVSYETANVFEISPDFKILNPRLFRELFLNNISRHFFEREEEMGAVVSDMFID